MDAKKLVPIVIAFVVGIVTFSTVLVPFVGNSQDGIHDTITNDVMGSIYPGYYATYTLDGEDDYKLETAPSYANFKINGQTKNISQWDYVSQKVVTDKCRVETVGHYTQVFDGSGTRIVNVNNGSKNVVIEYVASTKTLTITVYTDLTNTEVEDTVSYTVNQIIYADPNGTYGAIRYDINPDSVFYVNDLSQVVCGGAYLTGELDTSYFAEGETVYVGNSSYTGSATAVTQKYKDYSDVIEGDSFTVAITDGTNTETFTPFTVFVPRVIEGHTPSQDSTISILNVIPIMVILAMLVGVGTILFVKYRK